MTNSWPEKVIYIWVGLEAPDRNRCVICGEKSYGFIRDEVVYLNVTNGGYYCKVHLYERAPLALLRFVVEG